MMQLAEVRNRYSSETQAASAKVKLIEFQ
jgi:hypothetical protein